MSLCQMRFTGRKHSLILGLLLLPLLAGLVSCGKRPGDVDPPPEVHGDRFPLTYPDPSTDPAPTLNVAPSKAQIQ